MHFQCPPDSRLSVKTSRAAAKSILNFPTELSPGHICWTAKSTWPLIGFHTALYQLFTAAFHCQQQATCRSLTTSK
jgi:hypothetical protein